MLNNKINLLDKHVTILASGPSVENYLDSNKIAIIPNRSIVLPQLNNYEEVVWVVGTGWKRPDVLSWWKKKTLERTVDPSHMLVRYDNDINSAYDRFYDDFSKILPNTEITPIKITSTKFGIVSTGVECVALALNCGAEKINIAGMEMGVDTKYTPSLLANKTIMEKGDDSFTRHLRGDIEFFKNLNKSQKQKINPVKKSGLNKLYISMEWKSEAH